jgi:hypothetical protein
VAVEGVERTTAGSVMWRAAAVDDDDDGGGGVVGGRDYYGQPRSSDSHVL